MWSDVLNGNQRLEGLVSVLKSNGRLDELFNVKELYEIHFGKMNEIMRRIEEEHYGIDFGLFLYYEMGLPLCTRSFASLTAAVTGIAKRKTCTCARRSTAAATA